MLLIIENDPGFSTRLKQKVRLAGMKTFLVDGVADALFLLESKPADVMLANLASFGSPAELDRILDHAAANGTPLLMIEGFPGTAAIADHARSRQYGAFISLPFNTRDLLERLTLLRAGDDPLIGARIGPEGHQIEIVRKLGAGAMGAVYEGYEASLDRKVAVKFLASDKLDNPEIAQRFRHEARAVAQMRSPHVVSVFFVGNHDGTPYLVMEYIEGPTLGAHLKKHKSLDPREALRVVRQVLVGLVEAHSRGLVHRDLKPANIMLDRQGQAIILDFGLVRDASGENLTRAGMILGTPRYISPEQVRGQGVDQRSDLYAVGIMLFEMLIGSPPFSNSDHMAVLMAHVNEPFPRPESFGVALDPELFTIVERLTRKLPIERYQTAEEAIAAIEDHLVAAGHSSAIRTGAGPTEANFSAGMTMASPHGDTSSPTGSTRTPTNVRAVRSISFDSKPVPAEVVAELLDLFTEFLGPLAKRLAEKDAAGAGLDLQLLPSSSWSDLLNMLAGRISDDEKREAFVDRAVLLRDRF